MIFNNFGKDAVITQWIRSNWKLRFPHRIHIESIMKACKDSLSTQMHKKWFITPISRDIWLYLGDCPSKVLDVIQSIFTVIRCSLVILSQKLSETPRGLKEEVDPFLLVESMEYDIHDDVLAFDPAQKILWLSSLS